MWFISDASFLGYDEAGLVTGERLAMDVAGKAVQAGLHESASFVVIVLMLHGLVFMQYVIGSRAELSIGSPSPHQCSLHDSDDRG